MSSPKITAAVSLLLKRLIREYPECFKPEAQPPVPLAHSIHWAILDNVYPDTPPLVVRDALRVYCNRQAYQLCLVHGAARVDLDGKPVGVVDGNYRRRYRRLAPVSANEVEVS